MPWTMFREGTGPGGHSSGFAPGSENSIPDFVLAEDYLAKIRATVEFNTQVFADSLFFLRYQTKKSTPQIRTCPTPISSKNSAQVRLSGP